MPELPTTRKPLKLAWSEAIAGAELYDGEDVQTFSTGWHFHEGWQVVAVTKGRRHYEFKSGCIVARPGHLVLVPPRLVHRARCLDQANTSFKIATLPAAGFDVEAPTAPISWFAKHIGLSPLAFHTRARLMRARKLISEGWSLADTSLSLSFSDQSHFGRQFRKVYGMTPGEYQQDVAQDRSRSRLQNHLTMVLAVQTAR